MILTKKTRRAIFYGLALFFALLSPFLISYAFGYAFDFTTWEVEQTGGIFIKSKNPRVSITLDGEYLKETSLFSGNALVTDRALGPHDLLITKEGYHPWEKKVEIYPLTVSELRDIILVPLVLDAATSTPEEQNLISARAILKNEQESVQDFFLDKKKNLVQTVGTSTRIIAEGVHSFARAGAGLLFVNKSGFLSHALPEENLLRVLGRPGFYLSHRPFTFISSPLGEIAIIDSAEGLFLLDTEGNLQTIGGGVKNILFNPSGAKALIIKEKSIDLLWREKNPYQPFQKTGAREEVIALSEDISQASWFYADAAHVVILTKTGILFADLDGRGGTYVQKIFSGSADEIITTPDAPRKIFYRVGKEYYTVAL